MALPLALLMLISSMLMPMAIPMLHTSTPQSHEHCLQQTKAEVLVYIDFERGAELRMGQLERSGPELPPRLMPPAWCCPPSTERTIAALIRHYRQRAARIALSAPSWLLIFPFNAFW